MSTDQMFEGINGRDVLGGHANADGRVLFTRKRRHFTWPVRRARAPRPGREPGSGMVATATALLFLLGAGLLAVSLAAQYAYVFSERHQRPAALIEGLALDLGMLIFALLALGLARSGKPARVERALIIACAAGSALMNFAPADPTSWRSILSYVMPPVFLAVVADRVISVVRRAYLRSDEASAWRPAGRAAVAVLRGSGVGALYVLRLFLAPRSTLAGGRRAVLLATPLPSAGPAKAIEPAATVTPPAAAPGGGGIPDEDWSGADWSDEAWSPRGRRDGAASEDPSSDGLPTAPSHPGWRSVRDSVPRSGTKTARFLALVEEKSGPLAEMDLRNVGYYAGGFAHLVDLHEGSARTALRAACLAAREQAEAAR